jgi:hypothetical protein
VLAGTADAAAATAQPAQPPAADPDAPPKRATHLKLVD